MTISTLRFRGSLRMREALLAPLLTFPQGNGEAKSAAQRRSLAPTRS
jgi:hypothetical protein